MMIGDDHLDLPRLRVSNRFVGADAGVAGDDQFGPLGDDPRQVLEINSVALLRPDWDVPAYVCTQGLQALDQDGCRSLSVHIEITPDADRVPGAEAGGYSLSGGS